MDQQLSICEFLLPTCKLNQTNQTAEAKKAAGAREKAARERKEAAEAKAEARRTAAAERKAEAEREAAEAAAKLAQEAADPVPQPVPDQQQEAAHVGEAESAEPSGELVGGGGGGEASTSPEAIAGGTGEISFDSSPEASSWLMLPSLHFILS